MQAKLRHWIALILIALLPFQAFAGTREVSCADWMAHCPGVTAGVGDCCGHDAGAAHGGPASSSMSMASCAGATTCAPVMAAAALPCAVPQLMLAAVPQSWAAMAQTSFISHIPDGLRRPPRFLP